MKMKTFILGFMLGLSESSMYFRFGLKEALLLACLIIACWIIAYSIAKLGW
jgi:hypothetical protein